MSLYEWVSLLLSALALTLQGLQAISWFWHHGRTAREAASRHRRQKLRRRYL